MRTLHARPALLASLIVAVVATMGLGLALWTDQLNVGATVNTGDLNVGFTSVSLSESPYNPKDMASCNGGGIVLPEGDKATVTVTNAFPGYSCILTTSVGNVGTVDAVLKSVYVSGETGLFDIEQLVRPNGGLQGGAPDGEVYRDGEAKPGPAWRVTFQSDDNNTENHTGDNAYKLTFSANFENAAPTP